MLNGKLVLNRVLSVDLLKIAKDTFSLKIGETNMCQKIVTIIRRDMALSVLTKQ